MKIKALLLTWMIRWTVLPAGAEDFLRWYAARAPIPSTATLGTLALLDDDYDGQPSILEYAFGGDLAHWNAAPTTGSLQAGKMRIEFTRPKGLNDIAYIVQVSDSLPGDWLSGSSVALDNLTDFGVTERLIFRDARPASSPRAFMRLAVMFRDADDNNDEIFDVWQWQSYGSLFSPGALFDTDGDGIPDLEDADPTNAAVGRMTINITFPANGATLQ